jgi:hypothetical protein
LGYPHRRRGPQSIICHDYHANSSARDGLRRSQTILLTALLTLLLPLGTGVPVHGQGVEWDTLNDEVSSLYRKGQYDCAVVVAKKALQVAEQKVGPTIPMWPRVCTTSPRCTKPKASTRRPSRSTSARWRQSRARRKHFATNDLIPFAYKN